MRYFFLSSYLFRGECHNDLRHSIDKNNNQSKTRIPYEDKCSYSFMVFRFMSCFDVTFTGNSRAVAQLNSRNTYFGTFHEKWIENNKKITNTEKHESSIEHDIHELWVPKGWCLWITAWNYFFLLFSVYKYRVYFYITWKLLEWSWKQSFDESNDRKKWIIITIVIMYV